MKKYLIAVLVLLVAGFVAGCSLFGSDGSDGSCVMTIDDDKISEGEFSVYLYEQKTAFEEVGGSDIWDTDFDGVPASDVAKDNAYNSVIYVKTACRNAEDVGVSLNDEDKAEAKASGEEIYNKMGAEYCESVNLSLDDITTIMEESIIHQKVMDYITRSYQLSSADYSAYIDNYIADHPDDNTPRATLESTLREGYIQSKKYEIYQNQIEKWGENIKVEKNAEVWDNISVEDFNR